MKTSKLLWAVAMAVLAFACGAQAQNTPPITGLFTGLPSIQPGGATSNLTSSAVILHRANGIAIYPTLSATNSLSADTNTVDFSLNVSYDGVTYTTTDPLTYSLPLNGTNTVVGYKLFPASTLDHARYVRITKIVNNAASTNGANISVRWSYFSPYR